MTPEQFNKQLDWVTDESIEDDHPELIQGLRNAYQELWDLDIAARGEHLSDWKDDSTGTS